MSRENLTGILTASATAAVGVAGIIWPDPQYRGVFMAIFCLLVATASAAALWWWLSPNNHLRWPIAGRSPSEATAKELTLTEVFERLCGLRPDEYWEDRFVQALYDGEVVATGRRVLAKPPYEELSPRLRIEAPYWEDSQIEWVTAGPGGPERTKPASGKPEYVHLRFNVAQVAQHLARIAGKDAKERTDPR